MRPFVPAFDALWDDKKLRLHNATRSIFLRLCQKARDAGRDGEFVLAPERDDVASLMRVCPGPRPEIATALRELTDPNDPMVAIEGGMGARVLRILSWDDWALLASRSAGPTDAEHATPSGGVVSSKRGGRPRKWESEADRSRARRTIPATGNPTGNVSGRPETGNRLPTGNVTGYSTGNPGAFGGVRGGASDVQIQNRSEEIRREEKSESARAGARGEGEEHEEPAPDTIQGRALAALRASPELARCADELGLDLDRCALILATEAAKEVVHLKVSQAAAPERVLVAIEEVEAKVRQAAATRRPLDAATIVARLESFARTNLRKSSGEWAAERQRREGASRVAFAAPSGGEEGVTVEPWRTRTDLAPPPPPRLAKQPTRRGPLAGALARFQSDAEEVAS